MREKEAADLFERQFSRLGERLPPDQLHPDMRERLDLAARLSAINLGAESRNGEWTRARMVEAFASPSRLSTPTQRRWWSRHPVMAAGLSAAVLLLILTVASPGTVAALVQPVERFFRVGEHAAVLVPPQRTPTEMLATLAAADEGTAGMASWHWDGGRYGGFGGSIPDGRSTTLKRVSSLQELRSETRLPLQVPVNDYREFDHALVAPDGSVFMFFGSGRDELLIHVTPMFMTYVRYGNVTEDGKTVFRAPERKVEELVLNGRKAVWDPKPDAKAASLLMWETDGATFMLMGSLLTRDEAESLFLSMSPFGDQ